MNAARTVDLISKILIPVVIALVGFVFTYYQSESNRETLEHQREADQNARTLERLTGVMNHLTSDSARARRIGMWLIRSSAEAKTFNRELSGPVVGALGDEDATVRELAKEVLTQLVRNSPDAAFSMQLSGLVEAFNQREGASTTSETGLGVLEQLAKENATIENSLRARATAAPESRIAAIAKTVPKGLYICSFNIQFLGSSKDRDSRALASVLRPCDIVVVQEVVAPPYPGAFPDGSAFQPDPDTITTHSGDTIRIRIRSCSN